MQQHRGNKGNNGALILGCQRDAGEGIGEVLAQKYGEAHKQVCGNENE